MEGVTGNNDMNRKTLLLLFLTSYAPLFLLIALRYTLIKRDFLIFGGLSIEGLILCLKVFWLPLILLITAILSIVCCRIFLKKLDADAKNGNTATIEKIENRNSESLGYIATYIIPFVSTNGEDIVEVTTFLFLMVIIYGVYIRSNMVLINPVVNLHYSIYNIEYICGKDKRRDGLVIVRGNDMAEDEKIKLYQIGFKIFYGKRLSNRN